MKINQLKLEQKELVKNILKNVNIETVQIFKGLQDQIKVELKEKMKIEKKANREIQEYNEKIEALIQQQNDLIEDFEV